MRTIKFRGKRIDNGLWMYGFVLHCDRYTDIWSAEGKFDRREVDPETVGQFTGLLDINGKEIYEGDIVRVRVTNARFTKNPMFKNGLVKYDDYYGRWDNGFHGCFFSKRMEVIGNILDNPELLKGGNQ